MKKNLLTLLLVCVMALSFSLVSFAADNVVDGGKAVTDVKAGNAYILDVRSNKVHAASNMDYIEGVYHLPVFDDDNKLDTEVAGALHATFTSKVTDPAFKDTLSQKPIYILCNSGSRGAVKGTELLVDAGYDAANIHTITNGAKSLEIRYAFLNVNNAKSGVETFEAIENGNAVILDVRSNTNYNKGHLALSLHIPVFSEENVPAAKTDDTLAQDFVKAAKDNAELKDKTIYVLCNGGARGARAATVLLVDAGYAKENIITITGGAGAADVKPSLVPTVSEYKFVSGSDSLKAADNNAIVIDVRTEANFQKGSITEYNWPLFNASGVTNGRDDLAKAFLETVGENAELLAGKKIYILCNSGSRGAQNATQLLAYAGYNVATTDEGVVYTIKNGAKDLEIRYSLLNVNNKQTGTEALEAAKGNDAVILDVRNNTNYNKGHLKGSIHIPVFSEENVPVGKADDDLAKAFLEAVKDNAALKDKKIYILCNGGARGARAATVLLSDAGYALENIITITGGAGAADVKPSLVPTAPSNPSSPVTGETISMGYVLIMVAAVLAFVSKKRFA